MDLGLDGRRALVTGASRGLGRACAESLVAEGARVAICARNEVALKQVANEIGAATWIAADLMEDGGPGRAVESALVALGGLDILVANAGGPPTGPFEHAGDSDWSIAFDLTLMSAVRLIRAALPYLKRSDMGRIINITGYGVKEPMSDLVVSDALRAAVTVTAKTIATDLAPFGITVNNIAPGPILTDRLRELYTVRAAGAGTSVAERIESEAALVPVGRVGRPEEVAGLCAYLCSSQAGFITGQSIVIDGGVNRAI